LKASYDEEVSGRLQKFETFHDNRVEHGDVKNIGEERTAKLQTSWRKKDIVVWEMLWVRWDTQELARSGMPRYI
jgi:hypothetical protein